MSSSPRLPYMPFFVSDYLGKTRHLTLAERGAYCDLLFHSWNIGPLPKERNRLASMLGCTPKELSAVWPKIRDKFTETPAGYVNDRLEAHRLKATAKLQGHIEGANKTNQKLGRRSAGKVVHLAERRAATSSLSDTVSDSLTDSLKDA
jgi:uncharacterized protein YdaU (DUF1376 family)